MCSPEFVGARHKGNFLRKAVLSENWAKNACFHYTANQHVTFSMLHQLLTAALVQQKRMDESRQNAMLHSGDIGYVEDTFYGGHFSTGNRGRHFRCRLVPNAGSLRPFRKSKAHDGSSVKCFKCGTCGHFANECPNKGNSSMKDAVRARVREYGGNSRAVAETLYEMADNFDLQEELGANETIAHGVFESLFIEDHEMDDTDRPVEGSLNAEERTAEKNF
jgi:hypothetical protein